MLGVGYTPFPFPFSVIGKFFPPRNASFSFSDFGVSVWGKDFSPGVHGCVVRRAAEERYLPRVDVFLPVCGEPTALLANSWSFVRKLDYPATHLTVHVLDDGARDDIKPLVAQLGFRCEPTPSLHVSVLGNGFCAGSCRGHLCEPAERTQRTNAPGASPHGRK